MQINPIAHTNVLKTRIDFYVLRNQSANGALKLACKIVQKAYSLGYSVYLNTRNQQESEILDELLWTFSQNSFVPHELDDATKGRQSPVLIGKQPIVKDIDMIVSLATEPIPNYENFPRIAEIVGFQEEEKMSGRDRFRYYRECGIEPLTHHITL